MKDAASEAQVSVESLVSQIADDFMQRLARGERPDVGEYVRRHPQIARVLEQVLPALEALREVPAAVPEVPGRADERGCLGDFRLMDELGRGGMGVVYLAEQISLNRRVALKVLPLAATLDPRQLQRFKNEAQAAAHLHHAHIVPVFGVGCERGVHYYAMQFIDGQPLSNLIRELRKRLHPRAENQPQATLPKQGLADTARLRDRLSTEGSITGVTFFHKVATIGIQAAEALEHAHQQGVVHRDIKPANLLMDLGGNIWVADFGLAHCQSVAGLTMTGDVVGTLRYMSPEQALGRRETVDHRTDLYSLGMTLHELLTLEPALSGMDREELLRQIAFEDPPGPRRGNTAVPEELDTIVLKAMAKNPAERYATAQELADDLRRYLQDQPIRARRPGMTQRLQKWARRHRAIVASGLLALLAMLVALAASTVFIWRAKKETEAALITAGHNYQEAHRQRRFAESQRQRARQAVNDYFTTVSESALLDVPGLQPLRKNLLESALKYYEAFLRETADDPRLQVEVAAAHFRVAQIQAMVGALESSQAAFEKCFTLLEALRREHAVRAELFRPLAGIYQGGRLMHRSGRPSADPQRALELFRRGTSLWEQFARDDPSSRDFVSDLAGFQATIAELHAGQGARQQALAAYQSARVLWEKLVSGDPALPAYQAGLADVCHRIGFVLRQAGQLQEALQANRQALALTQKLVKEHPADRHYQQALASSYERIGISLHHSDPAQAEAALRQALRILRELAVDFPSVPAFREGVAVNLFNLANLMTSTDRSVPALEDFAEAIKIMDRLAADFPGQSDYRRRLASYVYGMALALGKSDRAAEAAELFRKALTIRRALVAESSRIARYQADLAWQLATCPLVELRDPAQALRLARQAVETSPRNGNRWITLGVAHYRLGDWDAALQALRKSLEFPTFHSSREWFLAMTHWQLGRKLDARGAYQKAAREKQEPEDEESRLVRLEAEVLLGK